MALNRAEIEFYQSYSNYSYEELNYNLNNKKIYLVLRRFLEVVFTLAAIIITLPVILLFSFLICLESKGSPFYSQVRSGLHGRNFKIYKLRSMRTDAERNGPQWASKNDNRITKVGKIIRKTRIDEIPQLYNVLKGEMSIFGPRPERPIFVKQFSIEIPDFKKRLLVKPGLTGWAQVNGGYDISPKEKLELDLYYINNINPIIDLKIIVKTIIVVLTGEGAR